MVAEVPLAGLTSALPLSFSDGIDVDLGSSTAADPVTVNVLAWPRLVATSDGRPVAVAEDAWGRLVAAVSAGAKMLAIRYRPDWQRGLASALVPAGMAAVGLVFLPRRSPLMKAQRAEI